MANLLFNFSRSVVSMSRSPTSSAVAKSLLAYPPTAQLIFRNDQRMVSFFNRYPAARLWTTMTTVSKSGQKRGRGKTINRSLIKDFNRGQMLGLGKSNIRWPGLSAPILKGSNLVQMQQLPEDPTIQERLNEIRSKMGKRKRQRQCPLDRGYSGGKMAGMKLGPPDPVDDQTFDGFQTILLSNRPYRVMRKNGRYRWIVAYSVTGNGKGICGFALARSSNMKKAINHSRNRAGQRLLEYQIYNNQTVYHDFFTQFGRTKIWVYKKPPGYGLVTHRIIKSICEVLGIKDLTAKIEGSTNAVQIIKAFLMGLYKQKTHQDIANEKGLHLVEMCRENFYYPNVLASPKICRTEEEIPPDENMNYTEYCFDGKRPLKKARKKNYFATLWTYERYLKKQETERNKFDVRMNLMTEYKTLKSFLTKTYPECKRFIRKSKKFRDQENK